MNKQSFIFIVLIACTCHAIYHLKQITPYCDAEYSLHHYTWENDRHFWINITAHGYYMDQKEYKCWTDGCKLSKRMLIRPDYVEPGYDAGYFVENVNLCPAGQAFIYHIYNPFSFFEDWFQYREPAVYQGKNCFKYYNDTTWTNLVAYGNDETNEVFYYEMKEDVEVTHYFPTVIPVRHSPIDFTFNSSSV